MEKGGNWEKGKVTVGRKTWKGWNLTMIGQIAGSILSVDSNQNVESKTKNVEFKIEKCVVQSSICI